MMTICVPRGTAPTLRDIRERFRLGPDDLDPTFGIIAVDPNEGRYTVMVEERSTSKLHSDANWEIDGPFANPRVDPAR
jgi:hypothetical protein